MHDLSHDYKQEKSIEILIESYPQIAVENNEKQEIIFNLTLKACKKPTRKHRSLKSYDAIYVYYKQY